MLEFDTKNTLILIIAVINIAYGSIIYLKDKKNTTSIWFFLLAISVGLWGVGMFLFRLAQDENLTQVFARILYFSAALIPIAFVYFSAVFPSASSALTSWQKYVLPIPFFLIAILSLAPDFLIKGTQFVAGDETHILYDKFYHAIYVFYIIIYFGYGYFLLIKKYIASRVADTVLNSQIVYILAGTSVSTAIGVFANLLGPYVGIFKFNWLGQIGNIVMISTISYAVVKHHLFSIRLILVEMAVLILNILVFVNIFTSHAKAEFTLNTLVFLFIFLFSSILMRSIYKDIRNREYIAGLVEEMEGANERMRIMEAQKTEFVSIASHQLRTPLTVIKGYASMVLEGTFGALTDEARNAVEKLYKSSEKVVALVEDLLTVSRIEQGKIVLAFERVDFMNFIHGILAEIDKEAQLAKIKLVFVADTNKDFSVSIDPKKFKQVVAHLFENALKYTPAGGSVRVAVSSDAISRKVRLVISDTGVGMAPEHIKAIFERFSLKEGVDEETQIEVVEQKDEVASDLEETMKITSEAGKETKEEGSLVEESRTPGIGLYIAQEIIEAHHGDLRIESAGTNKGVTVIVELPAAV